MIVQSWTARLSSKFANELVRVSMLLLAVCFAQSQCRADEARLFSLLPPDPGTAHVEEQSVFTESSVSDAAPLSHGSNSIPPKELPPAFSPTKRLPLLPPAFDPKSTATHDSDSPLSPEPDDSEIRVASNFGSPFEPPDLSLDESTLLIGPDTSPAFAAPNASPFELPTDNSWAPSAPPIVSSEISTEGDLAGFGNDNESAEDRDFYDGILQHPQIVADDSLEVEPALESALESQPRETDLWWRPLTSERLRNAVQARPVSINSLLAAALQYSAQIQVISDTPLIRETAIIESDASFDWSGFMETTWYDTNEPVGSTLTTGGPPRFENKLFEYEYGLRKQTASGGRFEVGQRYGHENSNSIFFIPNDQGTTRFTMNYTQPLLRGAGRVYNTSLVLLAQVEAGAARNEFSRELQAHLLEVTRAYWTLYLERGSLIQKQRLFHRGKEILTELEHRESIDAVKNQIVRARAAVAARESDLFRSAAAVSNAEGRIRALVNAPELGILDEFELMPVEHPTSCQIPVDMRQSLETSFRNRPEIHSAIKQIKASSVRRNMSKNELLPALDVVLETYVAGLRGESDVAGAWSDMFSDGRPSYSAGLQLDIPLRNREAKARFQRRALETRQFQNQFRATLHAMQLEVEISVREVQTSHREMIAKHLAMNAAASEVQYIDRRWRLLPGENRTASLVLEDLLGAQERLTAEEFDLLNAQVTYNLALTNLHKATGTLLHVENVSTSRSEECGLPRTQLHKTDAMGPTAVAPVMFNAHIQ